MKRVGGFVLAEIMVALFFITMAIVLVGTLGQQVMNLSKSSKQTAAVLELRTKTNSISRNTAPWLEKMRTSIKTGSLYSGCIPDSSMVNSNYVCPQPNDGLLDADAELKAISVDGQFHVVSAPIVDAMGEQIAGSLDQPFYLNNEGRPCTVANAATTCPMKSTGYFMRSNPDTVSDPGYVKFVVKVEKNLSNINPTGNTTPMKPQYLSMEVGNEWKDNGGTCPSGSVRIGYLTNGSANCVNWKTSETCTGGQYKIGVDSTGALVCKSVPTCTVGSPVLDPKTNEFVCSAESPCNSGQLFMGFFAGTGKPMCSASNVSCDPGFVQVGMKLSSTSGMEADCKALPSCTGAQRLNYDGSKFVCDSAVVAETCGPDEYVVGKNADGTQICAAIRAPASVDQDCPAGQVVGGIRADGSPKCRPETVAAPVTTSTHLQFVSPEIDFDTFFINKSVTVDHNLGGIPDTVTWVAVNKVADLGYNPGDEIPIGFSTSTSSVKSATQLRFLWYSPYVYPIVFIHGTDSTQQGMINADDSSYGYMKGAIRSKWRLKVYASRDVGTPLPGKNFKNFEGADGGGNDDVNTQVSVATYPNAIAMFRGRLLEQSGNGVDAVAGIDGNWHIVVNGGTRRPGKYEYTLIYW